MKEFIKTLLTVMLLTFTVSANAQSTLILPGDYPDPSILRDGKDYYMTHSPFFYTPGFLIWHSTDLVNWEPVCRAATEWEGSAMAPDLVKVGEYYYIYFPAAGVNWVVRAKDIRGPWSKPYRLEVKGIDPGHVVGKDGKRYLFVDKGEVVPLSDDGLKVIGPKKKVYDGWQYPSYWNTECMCLESPKLTFHDGYYYLTSAEGGTAGPATSHMVASARAKDIYGPWENSPYNPIVHTYSADEPWWSKGHGTLVDDVDGNWWIVYHAYAKDLHSLGRQTLIEPIEWTKDGWFRPSANPKPLPAKDPNITMPLSDDFKSKTIGLQWTFWREYPLKDVKLGKGITMKGKGTTPADGRLLLTTATDPSYTIETELSVGKNAEAGLLLYYSEKGWAGLTTDGKTLKIYSRKEKFAEQPNTYGNKFKVRIENDRGIMTVSVSKDGNEWSTVADKVDVSALNHNNLGWFYAIRPTLYVSGKGKATFSYFKYTAKSKNTQSSIVKANKPLYRDPIYDGAADPTLIYNKDRKAWWMFYTNRRANAKGLDGVSWVHGTPIGIAESKDGGATWQYVQDANISLPSEIVGKDSATYWAPDVIEANGKYHMFLTVVPGIFTNWSHPRNIVHLVSSNLKDWTYADKCKLITDKVIDASLIYKDSTWYMFYNNEVDGKSICLATSGDLVHWQDQGKIIGDKRGEGPKAFWWKDRYFMIVDNWDGQGVYSSDDLLHWKRQKDEILSVPGLGKDDGVNGNHADVVVNGDRAYIFYFTHPGRANGNRDDNYDTRRSSIQVAELIYDNGEIRCDRNAPVYSPLR